MVLGRHLTRLRRPHIRPVARPSVRSAIVTTARRLLHARGYGATSVDDLTRAAGVPKGSFYNYFASKEALAREVLRAYWADAISSWEATPGTMPYARLVAHFHALTIATERFGLEAGCLIGNLGAEVGGGDSPLRDDLADVFSEWTDRIGEIVRDGQSCGELPLDCDSVTLSRYLIAAWEGAVLRAKIERSSQSLLDFIALLPRMAGLNTSPKETAHDLHSTSRVGRRSTR